jgi:hypothetical protein
LFFSYRNYLERSWYRFDYCNALPIVVAGIERSRAACEPGLFMPPLRVATARYTKREAGATLVFGAERPFCTFPRRPREVGARFALGIGA